MKYLALKATVLFYVIAFVTPLFFILHLPNNTGFIILKVILGLLMFGIFYTATTKHPEITLGAFICYLGLLFVLWWYFAETMIVWLLSFLSLVLIWTKFSFINKTKGEGMFSPEYEKMKQQHSK